MQSNLMAQDEFKNLGFPEDKKLERQAKDEGATVMISETKEKR